MSSTSTKNDNSKLRPNDELEGSLLVEMANSNMYQYPPQSEHVVATAIPCNSSDLTSLDNMKEAQYLPTYEHLNPKRDDEYLNEKLRDGTQKGLVEAEDVLEKYRDGRRHVYVKTYYEKEAVRAANKQAARRDKEGLQIMEDKYHTRKGNATTLSHED